MKRITITRFRTNCVQLLDDAQISGESIEILKHGKVFATVCPSPLPDHYQPGMSKDLVRIVGDILADGSDLGIEWEVIS